MNIFLQKKHILFLLVLFIGPQLATASNWHTKPKILNMSDAVQPGKSFRINGFGFTENDELAIFIEQSPDGKTQSEPSSQALKPKIIQTDRNGNFIVAVMPLNAPPGIYSVWIKNDKGWSSSKRLNAARPLFLSERESFEGLPVQIVGRNFDPKEFGVLSKINQTKVRLTDAKKAYEVEVDRYNPYAISFIINTVPAGKYFVEVSNDGGLNWSRLENDQTLTVLKKPEGTQEKFDPLGIGISWISHFNWSNIYEVPASDGSKDVTELVQSLVDKAGADPKGGVIFFPDGIYKISGIDLPKNVVLRGESKPGTIISYAGRGKDFIKSSGKAITEGHVGIANLTITAPKESTSRPDIFINFGQSVIWKGVEDMSIRTASEMFVYNVKLDYDFTETEQTNRGLPICVIGKERLLIEKCDFKGFRLESHNYVSEYVSIKNNTFEFGQGVIICTADYLFLENNTIVGHREINREKHGFMVRGNAYIYNNSVFNTGSTEDPGNENWNDGEGICNEVPGGNHNFGKITGAGPNTVTVGETAGPFVVPSVQIYNHLAVMIVHGKGLGQYRRVKQIDVDKRSIVLEKEWDVIPDSTSRFTLLNPNENSTYYKNFIYGNPKGYWLFGNSIDCVVAENLSVDCDGIFMWSCRYINPTTDYPMYYFVPNYFNRIVGNVITGVSWKSNRTGIGMNTTRQTDGGSYYGVEVYATEIRDNYIAGDSSKKPLDVVTEAPAVSGIFLYATRSSSMYDGKAVPGDISNTIIEDNQLHSLSTGITLSRCTYGQLLRNNFFGTSVIKKYDISKDSQNTKVVAVNDQENSN